MVLACLVGIQGKGTQQFWELYKLYNIRDFKLDGIYLPGLIRYADAVMVTIILDFRSYVGSRCCLCVPTLQYSSGFSLYLLFFNMVCIHFVCRLLATAVSGWLQTYACLLPSSAVVAGNIQCSPSNQLSTFSWAEKLNTLCRQVPKMLGLFFVVTFGSCLDVAAIQTDMPVPIDFNRELGTVGLSNIVVGLSGSGYTGSYIFSQTIFSMRAGVKSAWHGAVIALMEAMIFLLPFSGRCLV